MMMVLEELDQNRYWRTESNTLPREMCQYDIRECAFQARLFFEHRKERLSSASAFGVGK